MENYEKIILGENIEDEWIHMILNETPNYLLEHEESKAESYRLTHAYMQGYSEEKRTELENAETKYSI